MAEAELLVVSCPECGAKLQARPSHFGKELPCPICGASVAVPRPKAGAAARPASAGKPSGRAAELHVLWCSNGVCGGKFGAKGKLSPERLRKMTCPTCGSPLTQEQPVQEAVDNSHSDFGSFLDEELTAEAEAEAQRQQQMAAPPPPEDPRDKLARDLLDKAENRCPKCRSNQVDTVTSHGGGISTRGAVIGALIGGIPGAVIGGAIGSAASGSGKVQYRCRFCGHKWS